MTRCLAVSYWEHCFTLEATCKQAAEEEEDITECHRVCCAMKVGVVARGVAR